MSNVHSTEEVHREPIVLNRRASLPIETLFRYCYLHSLEMQEGRTTEMAPHLTASSAHWLPSDCWNIAAVSRVNFSNLTVPTP